MHRASPACHRVLGLTTGLAVGALGLVSAAGLARPRQLPPQGHRRFRGRARQPAGRLRPRGRPQRHRQLAAQRRFHRGKPEGDARASRRQHARARPHDQERRRGDGDRHAAAVRPPGLARGRRGQHAGRRQVAAGRRSAGHAAVRRRRRDLCGQPGASHGQRLFRRRPGRKRHPGGADLGAHRRRRHRRARGRLRARPARKRAHRPAQPRLHHGAADRAGDQRPSQPTRPPGSPIHRPSRSTCRHPTAARPRCC